MSDSIRSFLAFDIENDAVRSQLAKMQAKLLQTGADVKLVETENIHITMRFLGDMNAGMVEKIFSVMKETKFVPFKARLEGLGVFPDLQYPRVAWAGIVEGANTLQDIFGQLEPNLRKLGFAPDNRGFSPHLTIARIRSGKNRTQLAEFIKQNSACKFGEIGVECLRLKKSILSPQGPTYSTLKEFCPRR